MPKIQAFNITPLHPQNPSQEEAAASLSSAKQDVSALETSGINTLYLREILAEAQGAFDGQNISELKREAIMLNRTDQEASLQMYQLIAAASKKGKIRENYSKTRELAGLIHQRKEFAYLLIDQIELFEMYVEAQQKSGKSGIDNGSTILREMVVKARQELQDERYEQAQSLLMQARMQAEELEVESLQWTAKIAAGQRTFYSFASQYWHQIAVIALLLLVISFIAFNEFRIKKLGFRLNDFSIEKDVLQRLLKRAQEDYFINKVISQGFFLARSSAYKKRMDAVSKNCSELSNQLKRAQEIRRFYFLS